MDCKAAFGQLNLAQVIKNEKIQIEETKTTKRQCRVSPVQVQDP